MRLLPPLLALASGYVLSFAYPGLNIGWLVWVWMFPLLLALWGWKGGAPASTPEAGPPRKKSSAAWRGFGLAFLAGVAFFGANLHWVRHSARVVSGARDESWVGWGTEGTGIGAVVGLAIYLSLYWGLWGAFAATIGRPRIGVEGASPAGLFSTSLESLRSAFLCAAAWVACEWLRGIIFTGFGWNGLGISMWKQAVLIQGAEFVGVTGLSFLPVFAACIGWNTILRFQQEVRTSRVRPHADFFCAVVLLLLNVGYGGRRLLDPAATGTKVNLALVQLNIGQHEKWEGRTDIEAAFQIYQDYGDLTRKALNLPDVPSPTPSATATPPTAPASDSKETIGEFVKRSDTDGDGKLSDEEFRKATEKDAPGAAGRKPTPDLVIWPESALSFSFFSPNHTEFLNDVLAFADYTLLTGTDIFQPDSAEEGKETPTYTGAAMMRGNFDNHQLYRKVHLVPFGEYLPGRQFPLVDSLLGRLVPGDFASGGLTEPLTLAKPAGVQLIPLICFEDTVGRLARKFARDAPQLIVNMTNDGWFFHSEANEQHLSNAVFRCVELRRPMVRACNTGITCEVDAWGRVPADGMLKDANGSPFLTGVLPLEVTLNDQPGLTFYARYGDVFSIAMLVISGLAMLAALLSGRRRVPQPAEPPVTAAA